MIIIKSIKITNMKSHECNSLGMYLNLAFTKKRQGGGGDRAIANNLDIVICWVQAWLVYGFVKDI